MSAVEQGGRRAFLRSACRHCAAFGALGLGTGALAQAPAEWKSPPRFLRPSLDTDEGGLWSMMDREETRMRRSPLVVRDPALTAYLRDIVCRLGGEQHCADVRVYVVRTAQFNATMAPNGAMQVWSGLLLRVDNEAQLAAVLGHELGHYLERHTVERLRDLKNKAAAMTALAMFGLAGAVASLGVAASAMGFSRDQELRADQIGMRLLREAGYDGRQAAQIWDDLLAELKIRGGDDVGQRSALFASHPPAGDRRNALLKIAGDGGGKLGAEELDRVMAPHRLDWLQEELRRGQFEESLELFNRKLKLRPEDPQFLYGRGEVLRQRGKDEDLAPALADLQKGAALEKAPAELFRSLGLLHRRREDGAAANAAFEKYLALAPDAGDAALIQTYLTEVK
ncbi:M48 family metalloprotease [Ramlibacter montanisoli]|uniref:M48 family metalloprotease n=1 Tax=Ramlibacter montanisoli TaxID=2732512 RepID=A0A849KCL0_9BURK|nr:M48 family metalloprotease [Ramlibacter montanisoli]NNU43226.1 M48 family metalloprotease [Ramlibacter montanisoli]